MIKSKNNVGGQHNNIRPPASAVSASTGLIGVVSLAILVVCASYLELKIAVATMLLLFGTAFPMILWELLIQKSFLKKTSGLCFSVKRSSYEVVQLTYTKMLGLIVTSFLGYVFYHYAWWYSGVNSKFYFLLLKIIWPFVLIVAPLYIYFTSRYMVDPKDGLWHFGRLILLGKNDVSLLKVRDHVVAWAIKIFFLALMFSVLPGTVSAVLKSSLFLTAGEAKEQLVSVVEFSVKLLFMFDVCIGTIGYIFTLRVLDSHVVSPNKYLPAWIAAMVCYPPLVIMGINGPLDYHAGEKPWHYWLSEQTLILWPWAVALLLLCSIYVRATVIFGIRFSNLTNRGIVTNGPYRYWKHPAYLAKNIYWWMLYFPFASTLGTKQAIWNCAMLLVVNGIYYMRAKTEENHLMNDPAYVEYSNWIGKYGMFARIHAICFGIHRVKPS